MRRSRVALVPAALLAAVLAAPPARADLEVYRVRHRPAEELLPVVEAALGGAGRVALDRGTNALVIVADAALLRDVLGVLAQQDRALRNVVLHYESRTERELERAGVRVAWQVDAGSVRIGNVVVPGGGTRIGIAPEAARTRSDETLAGTLRVLEGERGRIATGADLPVTERRRAPWLVEERTTVVTADSGFEVEPRVLPDGRVQLALFPFDARVAGRTRAGPIVQRSGAETTLVVRPGETVAIGGLGGATAGTAQDVFGGAAVERRREDRLLLVRVELD